MWDLETITRMNAEEQPRRSDSHPLRHHPRIVTLRIFASRVPVGAEYRARLTRSIWMYAEQIVGRPVHAPEEGWDDIEALQQVTLSDWVGDLIKNRLPSQHVNH